MTVSLINAAEMADKASGLLSRLHYGVGFLPGFSGKKQDEEEAIRYLVEEIKKNPTMPPLVKSAYIAKARKILKAYLNQSAIIKLAVGQLSESNRAESVDDDWLSLFMDAAQHISNEKIQTIWATLLARECNSPGIIPKTLLHTLLFLPPPLAKKFEEICSYNIRSFDLTDPTVIIDHRNPKSHFSFDFDDLNELARFGLIFFSSVGQYFENGKKLFICKNNKEGYIAESLEKNSRSIPIGEVLLTIDGKQLCSILSICAPASFDSYIAEFAKHNSLKLTKILIKCIRDGKITDYEEVT